MRTINGFLRSTLVIFILIQQLVGQDEGKTEWTPGAVPMGSQIGLLAAFPVVKNAPYTADITRQQTTVLDGTKRLAEAHNIQRRDSNGRLLDEQVASPRIPLKDSEPFT